MIKLFSFENLLKAYYQCRKNKRRTVNAARFELNFENELFRLEMELQNRTYHPGQSICFVVTRPSLREVFAADFRDRVVHHLLVGYLEPVWEKIFIYHSCACRKNKGAHYAIKTLKRFLKKQIFNFSSPAYYLKADISAFFMSIRKDVLFNMIRRQTKHPDILWLARQIIFHDPTDNFYLKGHPGLFRLIPAHKSLFTVPRGQGLPIGNLSSQFFANVYLNELDQFVKHRLKVKHYLRYVDDILILHQSPDQLLIWLKEINQFLKEKLKIHLHPKKSRIRPVCHGIDFVGFIIKPHYSLVRRRTSGNLKRKLWEFNQIPLPKSAGIFNEQLNEILSVVNSYYGQFKHANTFSLRKSIYQKHFKILKSWLEPSDKNFNFFKIKRGSIKPGS